MKTSPAAAHVASRGSCLSGAGEMAALMRTINWAATALGAVEGWPLSLCTAVRILLGAHQGMWLVWGPQQVFLYNDAWRTMTMAERHPAALGHPAAEVWPDMWPAVQERIAQVLATGSAAFDEELMLLVQRGDRLEETYYTVSYCPVPGDDGQISGLFCIGVDDTARVLQERRMRCLRKTFRGRGHPADRGRHGGDPAAGAGRLRAGPAFHPHLPVRRRGRRTARVPQRHRARPSGRTGVHRRW